MSTKTLFPRFRCRDCPYLLTIGPSLAPTYYCDGFPGKRKPKRFPRSGPTYPKPWCPKLISPPICRIYGFLDDRHRFMDSLMREAWEAHPKKCISPERRRYEVKAVPELGLTAAQFFEDMRDERLSDVFPNIEFEGGEVIEIDDGLRPFQFYVYANSLVIPVDSYSWCSYSDSKHKKEE